MSNEMQKMISLGYSIVGEFGGSLKLTNGNEIYIVSYKSSEIQIECIRSMKAWKCSECGNDVFEEIEDLV